MNNSGKLFQQFFKSGLTFDWQDLRTTAFLLIPFIFILIFFPGYLFNSNIQSSYSLILWLAIFYFFYLLLEHGSIGVKELIEDYIHNIALKSSILLCFDILSLISFNNLIIFFFFS